MRVVRAFLPAVIWMFVIFAASTDLGSSRHTSRFIGPFVRWFVPDASEETIRTVQLVARKAAHLVEYAMLAVLLWRGFNVMRPGVEGWHHFQWHWREVWVIVPICMVYAISDEFHQSYYASRQGSAGDVLIDTVGAFGGLLAIWAIGRSFKRW